MALWSQSLSYPSTHFWESGWSLSLFFFWSRALTLYIRYGEGENDWCIYWYISITNMSRAGISFGEQCHTLLHIRSGVGVGVKNFKYWIRDLFVWLLCDIFTLVFVSFSTLITKLKFTLLVSYLLYTWGIFFFLQNKIT